MLHWHICNARTSYEHEPHTLTKASTVHCLTHQQSRLCLAGSSPDNPIFVAARLPSRLFLAPAIVKSLLSTESHKFAPGLSECYSIGRLCKSRHQTAERQRLTKPPSVSSSLQASCTALPRCVLLDSESFALPGTCAAMPISISQSSLCRSQMELDMHIMVVWAQGGVPSSPLPW